MKKITSLLLILFIQYNVNAQADKAENAIQQIFQEEKIVGLSVAVVKNNKMIYTHSFGVKNLETGAYALGDKINLAESVL